MPWKECNIVEERLRFIAKRRRVTLSLAQTLRFEADWRVFYYG
jgi:hypothetical protein